MERCPICDVSVKPENLARHLRQNHPRDAKAQDLRLNLRGDAKYAPKPARASRARLTRSSVASIAAVLLLVAAAYVAAPYFDPNRDFSAESCIGAAQLPVYHIHVRLSVFLGGVREPVPHDTGISTTCTRVLHTHDYDYNPNTEPAVIHVESPVPRAFTLGDFFRIWGKTLTPTAILGCTSGGTNVVAMAVNGTTSTAFGSLVLADGQQVSVSCGPSA